MKHRIILKVPSLSTRFRVLVILLCKEKVLPEQKIIIQALEHKLCKLSI